MPRHVADHHAAAAVADAEEVIEVPGHALRRHHARRDDRGRRDRFDRRQELHLEIVRERHLVREALLLHRRAHELRVLDRGGDLRRDRGDELEIAGGERMPPAPPREIHDA